MQARRSRGVLKAMSNQTRRRRIKDSRKRLLRRSRLSWKQSLIYGPIVALVLTAAVGNYVIDLYQHPSLWNGMVLVVVIGFGTALVAWPKSRSRR